MCAGCFKSDDNASSRALRSVNVLGPPTCWCTAGNGGGGGGLFKKKKPLKNPEAETSFLPDPDREREEQELREKLKAEWLAEQERIKGE